jgi:hypothetical protein
VSERIELPRRVWWLALLAVALHLVNAAWIVKKSAALGILVYEMPDSGSYLSCAQALKDGVPFSPVFAERLLVPWLLYVLQGLGLPPVAFAGIPALLHGLVVPAVYLLTMAVTQRRPVAWTAAVLYVALPNLYQFGPEIGTDVLHAQLALLAVAATVLWSQGAGAGWWWGAVVCWPLAQMTRPSFFFVLPLLAMLAGPAWLDRSRRARAALLLLATLVAPLAVTWHNAKVYGVAAPSLTKPELLRRVMIPRINAFMRNAAQPQSMTDLFYEERDVLALADPDWAALRPYSIGPRDPEVFRRHYDALNEASQAYIDQHREWLFRSSFTALYQQFLTPPRFVSEYLAAPAILTSVLNALHKVALILIAAGLARLLVRSPCYVLSVSAMAFMLLAPLIFYLWVPTRARLPIELLMLPVLAFALFDVVCWALLGAVAVLGVGPRRLAGAGEAWLWGTALGAVVILLVYELRGAWKSWRGARAGGGRT